MNQIPDNQRRHPRVQQAVKVSFRFCGGPAAANNFGSIEAVTRNISEGGIFIELGKQSKLRDDAVGNYLLFKSTLELEIFLAGSPRPLQVQGKSVWIEKKVAGREADYCRGVAIQFTQIDSQDAAQIRDFVQSVLSEG